MDYSRPKSRWARIVRFLLASVLLLAAAAGMNFGLSRYAREMPTVDRRTLVIDAVQRGDMTHEVRGIGTLATEEVMWIPARSAGRVARIAMLPGSDVVADSLLIELTNPDLELALAEARSQHQSAQAELRTKKAELENESLTLQSDLVKLETEHELAQATCAVSQSLFERKVITEHQLKLDQLKASGLEQRLEVDRKRYKKFQQSLPDQYAIYEARVEQALAMLELQQSKVDAQRVVAGFAGVLEQVPVEVGQQVTDGESLAKVVNAKQLKGVLKIPEVQARYVEKGQRATVDTRHGLVRGTVSRIEPAVQDGTVSVDVTFADPLPEEARPDLSVTGTIEIARLKDVLFVGRPVSASAESTIGLFKLDEKTQTAVRVPVGIGVASMSHVEIREGLAPGDQVVLTDMSRHEDVDRILME